MAVSYVDAGTFQSGNATNITPWPAGHQSGDIGILCVQNYNSIPISFASGRVYGFEMAEDVGSATGVAHATHAYWCRASGNAMESPRILLSTNHHITGIVVFRGAAGSGNPCIVAETDKTSLTSGYECPSVTTTNSGAGVVYIWGGTTDSTSNTTNGNPSNANLANFSQVANVNISVNAGGNMIVWTGEFAGNGAVGTLSGGLNVRNYGAAVTVAIEPEPPAVVSSDTGNFFFFFDH